MYGDGRADGEEGRYGREEGLVVRIRRADREFCSRPALETLRNIIDVCASRACRVIGRRKLTCERPGNIARIKKPGKTGEKHACASARTDGRTSGARRTKIKIGGCIFVRFIPLFLSLFFFAPRSRSYRSSARRIARLYVWPLCLVLSFVRFL